MKDIRYDRLKAELEEIKHIADTQTHHYKLGQEYLYRGLAKSNCGGRRQVKRKDCCSVFTMNTTSNKKRPQNTK